MSLPREFHFSQELSKLDTQVLGTSAPPTTTALSCSIDLPTDVLSEAILSPEKAGSLLSVQSAPTEQRERPASLLLELPLATQVGAYLSAMSPTEQEEDSLLTLSSVTARPLLAASRKLRPPPDSSAESTAPPDGGYGWVVVFGAFMVQFWVAGLFKSYGVLYVEIMETFPDSSESVASWIPAALSTLCLALAPLSSALCEKYSCRLVVFIGGLFCATGLALSYFSKGLLHLLLSFGVMTGIGGGLSTTPGIVIVSQYFDKHRALANGICVSGTAAGSFVFPMLIEKLVDMYGLHGTVLLLGGGMLHVCVSATLYRPAPISFNSSALADRTPATTTTTEHTTLLHDIQEDQGIMFKSDSSKDNRLQNLFQPESERALNQKNLQLTEDAKRTNLITEIMHPSLIEVARQQMQSQVHSDSEDSEGLDVLGVVGLPREVARLRLRPTRSSSILHSVEDLSTDSTCVYKARRNLSSRSLYIRPPLPGRLILNKMTEPIYLEPIAIKQEEVQTKDVEIEKKQAGCVDKISRYLDVSLLKSWRFGLLCTSVALMSCGSPYALYYLPAYTVSVGHSKSAAGHLVAISAVLDLCGRLGLGWLCDLHLFCRRKAYIVSILVAGIAVLALPSLTSWWALAIASGAYGLCLGCWFLLVPVLLADAFGTARIASSYGLVRMFQSLAAVSVPPTADSTPPRVSCERNLENLPSQSVQPDLNPIGTLPASQILGAPTANLVDPAIDILQEAPASGPMNEPPEIDAELLQILGVDPTKIAKYGKNIQKDVALRFEHSATIGLTNEERKELIDKFPIPENCKLIAAPALNPETKAALSDNIIKRDKTIASKQTLMASAISGLGEAITLILSSKERNTELLRILMDTGRALCDCQHNDTMTRRNFILYAVKKEMRESLQNTKIDEFLFGCDLTETLKVAKAINKSGADLKPAFTPKPTSNKQNLPTTSKNWKGPTTRKHPPPRAKPKDTTHSKTARGQHASSSRQSQNQRAARSRR